MRGRNVSEAEVGESEMIYEYYKTTPAKEERYVCIRTCIDVKITGITNCFFAC